MDCEDVFFISFPEESVAMHERRLIVMSTGSCHALLLSTVCYCSAWRAWLSRAPLLTFLVEKGTPDPRVLIWQAAPLHWGAFFAFSVHSLQNCCAAWLKCSSKSLLQFAVVFHWPILSILAQTKSGW